jgi:hypothetical protein
VEGGGSRLAAQALITCAYFVFFSSAQAAGQYDDFGRLIGLNGKLQITCPNQNLKSGVLLAIGQSNIANHAEKKFLSRFPNQVVNYYDGKCYVASSPLLGASGEAGEFITPLADRLIEKGVYKSIIIISSGISGTPISRWQAGGDLNKMLLDTITSIKKYNITDIIWHQGESDFMNGTSAVEYQKSFTLLKNSLQDAGIAAPFFIAVATKCGNNPTWKNSNPTALGQSKLKDNKEIFLAVSTDKLLNKNDRRDSCHLSVSGQLKTANAYAEAIIKHRQSR